MADEIRNLAEFEKRYFPHTYAERKRREAEEHLTDGEKIWKRMVEATGEVWRDPCSETEKRRRLFIKRWNERKWKRNYDHFQR